MAVTVVTVREAHRELSTITFTADGNGDLVLPGHTLTGMGLQSDGVDGGGTLTILLSMDGTNFVASGVNTVADPRNTTLVTSITASGAWVLPAELADFRSVRFTLTGSTTPTLVLKVGGSFK